MYKTLFIFPNILVIYQNGSMPIAKMFMRFQSFYDSSELKNTVFSIEDVNKIYPDYENIFRGFNISDKVIEPFRKGFFNPLTQEELLLLSLTKNLIPPYYVIGVRNSDLNLLMHEQHHAFYYMYPEYKKSVDLIMDNFYSEINTDMLIKLYLLFDKFKYSLDIYSEEVSAYILSDKSALQKKGIWDKTFEKYHNLLDKHFEAFSNKKITNQTFGGSSDASSILSA